MARYRVPSLGRRGEGWVIAQSFAIVGVVFAGIAGPSWPDHFHPYLTVAGVAVAFSGAVLLGAGVVALGTSLSPYPRPPEGADLREGGAYRHVRHPIYGGLVLLALGWSLLSSPVALLATACLLLVFELKSRVEEAMLTERFPGYEVYRSRVRRRFVPGIH